MEMIQRPGPPGLGLTATQEHVPGSGLRWVIRLEGHSRMLWIEVDKTEAQKRLGFHDLTREVIRRNAAWHFAEERGLLVELEAVLAFHDAFSRAGFYTLDGVAYSAHETYKLGLRLHTKVHRICRRIPMASVTHNNYGCSWLRQLRQETDLDFVWQRRLGRAHETWGRRPIHGVDLTPFTTRQLKQAEWIPSRP